MPALQPILWKAYWALAGVGIVWAVFILSLCVPWVQRQYVFALLHPYPSFCLGSDFVHQVSDRPKHRLCESRIIQCMAD